MSEFEFQFIKSIGFVVAVAIALTMQRYRPHRSVAGSWRTNTGLWAINAVVMGALCGGCAWTFSVWAESLGIGLLSQLGVATWSLIPISVLALDFVSYFWHRVNHVSLFLWRFHQAHHCDSHFTVTTALRFHPGEIVIALPMRLLAIGGLGLPVEGVIVFEVIFSFSNFWEHGNIDLPNKLEKLLGLAFITPALHRRHHARDVLRLNTNYGTIFSFWDRILGSLGDSDSRVRVDTGLADVDGRLEPWQILSLPISRASIPK